MYILDAHNQNFIKSAAGIVPVDLVIGSQSSGISFQAAATHERAATGLKTAWRKLMLLQA